MRSRWSLYNQWVALVLVLLLIPVSVVADPQGAGKQIRVKMSLNVEGTYQHTGPKKIPEGAAELPIRLSVDNSYSVEYVVLANSEITDPQKVNPLDPASQKEMDEYNAKVNAREDRIYHSADNLRKPDPRMGGSGSPAGMNPGMMDMGRLQEMQEKVAACGNDQSCMQRVAMEMMFQQQASAMSSGPGAQVQADLQAISEMCINEKHQPLGTKGHEKCVEAEGRKRSMVPTSLPDDEPEVPELPDRYWVYWNLEMECQFKSHAKVNESYTFGIITDMGGEYREITDVDKREGDSDPQAGQPCAGAQAVYDRKANLYWTDLPLTKVEFQVTLRHETYSKAGTYGRVEHADEINRWIDSTLQGAPASGTKKEEFGFQTATFTWSFVRE